MGGHAVSDTNRHKARCYRCGGEVPPEKGVLTFEKSPGSRWPQARFQRNWSLVEHVECATAHKGTDLHFVYKAKDAL